MFIYLIFKLKFDRMRVKKSNFFNKRGVSPLIATVLLISFAVALGSVILQIGSEIDFSNMGETCSGVSIEIRDIDTSQVCYSVSGNNTYLNFIIDNSGNKDIDGLTIWIRGENGLPLVEFDDLSIKKGELLEIKEAALEYNFNKFGAIKYIEFIPKIKINDSSEICTKSSVRADKVGVCKT